MKIDDFIKLMEDICPGELAEEWDNSGIQIQVGSNVTKVLVTLEVTDQVVNEAVDNNVDMIVTHHPLFFGEFNQITEDVLPTKYAISLINNGISVYSTHTNFDSMEGGNNDYFANLIGVPKEDIESLGLLRIANISPISVKDMANGIIDNLDIPREKIRLIGDSQAQVRKIAWCTGAGADFIMDALDNGVDLFITGDVKYHEAMTIKEFGLNCLDVGHFGSEKIFTPNMGNILREALANIEDGPEIIESQMDEDPFKIIN